MSYFYVRIFLKLNKNLSLLIFYFQAHVKFSFFKRYLPNSVDDKEFFLASYCYDFNLVRTIISFANRFQLLTHFLLIKSH